MDMDALTKITNRLEGETPDHWYSPYLVVITVIFFVLVITAVVAALFVRSNSNADSQRKLEDAVAAAVGGIESELQQSISELGAIQAFFNASQFVSREEFSVFVGPFLE